MIKLRGVLLDAPILLKEHSVVMHKHGGINYALTYDDGGTYCERQPLVFE